MAYIEMQHCYKRYTSGETEIFANRDVSFEIEKGELVIILGASGAGKSTVLNILGGMDTNDEGQVLIDGVDIAKLNAHQRTDYRRDDVGFVFQFYNLVPNLTAKENVELASEIVSDALDPEAVLKEVGLGNRLDNFPAQLSGGEQQRIAIARAIVNNPKVLIADEPTGNLDPDNSWEIMNLLERINLQGTTVLMATHNSQIVNTLRHRVIAIENGRVVRDEAEGEYGYDD